MGSNRQMMGSAPIAEEPVKQPPPELLILAAITVYTITPLYSPEPATTPQRYNPISSTRTSPTPVKSTSRSIAHANLIRFHRRRNSSGRNLPRNIFSDVPNAAVEPLREFVRIRAPLRWVLSPHATNYNDTQITLTSRGTYQMCGGDSGYDVSGHQSRGKRMV
ncbi:hypothetical protein K439DRAFT_561676 [Ramaria rubella]|nr:hypothetical protein K439DRAFT_561676 [Ramaria rubella]